MEAQHLGPKWGPLKLLFHLSLTSVVLAAKWDFGQQQKATGRPSPRLLGDCGRSPLLPAHCICDSLYPVSKDKCSHPVFITYCIPGVEGWLAAEGPLWNFLNNGNIISSLIVQDWMRPTVLCCELYPDWPDLKKSSRIFYFNPGEKATEEQNLSALYKVFCFGNWCFWL